MTVAQPNSNGTFRVSREHWMGAVAGFLTALLMAGSTLAVAVSSIQGSIHAASDTANAAIVAQTAQFTKIQNDNEHRISSLEVTQTILLESVKQLTLDNARNHEIEEQLAIALQQVKDLLPQPRQR